MTKVLESGILSPRKMLEGVNRSDYSKLVRVHMIRITIKIDQ